MIKFITQDERNLKKEIMDDAEKKNIIRSATLELLDYCNFSCKYCYVKESYKHIITFDNAKKVLDQLKVQGCIWLLLTGGEPLIHPDFTDIYTYAHNLGFKISVFTNGHFINRKFCELFNAYSPEVIEISLYGHDNKSYDMFVGVEGAFETLNKNLDMLQEYQINTLLKFTMTTKNATYLKDMKQFCDNKNLKYRYDDMVIPRLDQDNSSCLSLRLCPKDAHNSMMSNESYVKHLSKKTLDIDKKYEDNLLYPCSAGKNAVVIDASLKMYPCIIERRIEFDLNEEMDLKKGQSYILSQMSGCLNESDKCFDCELKPFCRYCPARFALETGSERNPPQWYCEYGAIVKDAIKKLHN